MLRRHGIQAIAPAVYRLERHDGAWKTVARRAIPGYVFIRCMMSTLLYYHLMGKPGVLKLLGQTGDTYVAIPDGQAHWIEALHQECGEAEQTSHAKAGADGGFEIVDGPLLGLRDKITNYDMRRRRATVAIELYDDTYEVDLAVEPVDDNHSESPAG